MNLNHILKKVSYDLIPNYGLYYYNNDKFVSNLGQIPAINLDMLRNLQNKIIFFYRESYYYVYKLTQHHNSYLFFKINIDEFNENFKGKMHTTKTDLAQRDQKYFIISNEIYFLFDQYEVISFFQKKYLSLANIFLFTYLILFLMYVRYKSILIKNEQILVDSYKNEIKSLYQSQNEKEKLILDLRNSYKDYLEKLFLKNILPFFKTNKIKTNEDQSNKFLINLLNLYGDNIGGIPMENDQEAVFINTSIKRCLKIFEITRFKKNINFETITIEDCSFVCKAMPSIILLYNLLLRILDRSYNNSTVRIEILKDRINIINEGYQLSSLFKNNLIYEEGFYLDEKEFQSLLSILNLTYTYKSDKNTNILSIERCEKIPVQKVDNVISLFS